MQHVMFQFQKKEMDLAELKNCPKAIEQKSTWKWRSLLPPPSWDHLIYCGDSCDQLAYVFFKQWKKEQASRCCTADVWLNQSQNQLYNNQKWPNLFCFPLLGILSATLPSISLSGFRADETFVSRVVHFVICEGSGTLGHMSKSS